MSQRRALCIGIDAYAGRNRLGGCVNDTKKWSKFFTDRKFQVTVLTDQQATFDGIVTAIKTLIDSAVSGDIVAIHYSGHGTRVPDTSKEEVDGQDEALVPIDFGTKGFIVDDLIGPLIDRAKPGVAVHAFFDCCHSGGGTRLLATSDAAGSDDEKARFLVLTPKMIEVHNRAQQKRAAANQQGAGTRGLGPAQVLAVDGTMREVLFAACQPSEQAIESGGNGHFTRAAMAVLTRPATGLTNDQFLKAVITEMGAARRQTPQLSCSPGINTAPFLTSVSPAGAGNTAQQPVVPPASTDASTTPVRSSRGFNLTSNGSHSMTAPRSSSSVCLTSGSFRIVKHDCGAGQGESGIGTRGPSESKMLGRPFQGLSVPKRASDGDAGTRAVFVDGVGRLEVIDPHADPFGRICLLNFQTPHTPAGMIGIGTGWLIAPTVVITAGHCVYDGGWNTKMTVFPGIDDSDSSPVSARAIRMEAVDGWTNSSADNCDFGAIFLDRPLTTGKFDFAEFSETDLEQMVVNVAGYPSDRPQRTMWMQSGRMLDADDAFLYYKMDTHGGQSGCPVILWEDGNDFTVVGIHTGNIGTANRAVRINSDVFNQLMSWRDQA